MSISKQARSNWQKQVLDVLGIIQGSIVKGLMGTNAKTGEKTDSIHSRITMMENLLISNLVSIKKAAVLQMFILVIILINEIVRWFIR